MRKTSFTVLFGLLSWAITLLPACSVEPDRNVSRLDWGHLRETDTRNWAISFPPGSRLVFCGKHAQMGKNVFLEWAQAIHRQDNLPITTHESLNLCDTSNADGSLYFLGREDSDLVGTVCDENPLAISWSNGPKGIIALCQPQHPGMSTAMLHETGHQWGLCDQYPGSDNCDELHSSTRDNEAIMGNAWTAFRYPPTELQPDDIMGIRALAEREDIPANLAWAKCLQEGTCNGGNN